VKPRESAARVVFVCHGNICRSPLAEMYARDRARREGVAGVEFASAGFVEAGNPVSTGSASALRRLGIEPGPHVSRIISGPMLAGARLVLTMEEDQKKRILREMDGLEGRVFSLGEYAGQGGVDVDDPYGGSVEDYDRMAAHVKSLVDEAWPRLKEIATR